MRTVSWFSCGAASAVATKLAIADNPDTIVAYCEVKEEHPDNARFLKDCEVWFDKEIVILGNDKYDRSIYEVFRKTRYLAGPGGARCTGELKKKVREAWAEPDDINVFGYTVEEQDRLGRLIDGGRSLSLVDFRVLLRHGFHIYLAHCAPQIDLHRIHLGKHIRKGILNQFPVGW